MADDNVRLFPRMGTVDPPADPPDDPPAEPDPQPVDDPDEAPASPRRSPLETLAALGSRADAEPSRPEPDPDPVPDGEIPATFASETWGHGSTHQPPAPGLGSLSLAAVLAVSVAAMRGIHGAITGRRANREQRMAVADLAASGRGDKGGNRGSIPSSNEFGRRSLGRDRFGNRQGFFGGAGGRGNGGPSRIFGGRGSGRRGNTPSGSRSTGGFFGGGGSAGRGGAGGPGGTSGGPGPRKRGGPRTNAGSGNSGTGGAGKSSTGGSSGAGKSGSTGSGKSGAGGSGKSGTGGGRGPRRTSQRAGWFRKGKGSAAAGGASTGASGGKTGPKGAPPKGSTPTPKPKGAAPKGTAPGAKPGGPAPKLKGAGPKPKSPKAGAGPKGTLRSKRPKGTKPGVGAPGGPKPRKRGGKPVTTGAVKLPKGFFHGTQPGWDEGCRCPACTRAWAKGQTIVGRKVKLPTGVKHGSAAAYEDAECACKKCVKAAIRRNNTTPAGPVTLRQALGNEFERRWARRRKRQVPVIGPLSAKALRKAAKNKQAARKKRAAAAAAAATTATASTTSTAPGGSKVSLGKKPSPTTPPSGATPGATAPGRGRPGPSGPGAAKHRRTPGSGHWSRERRRSYERAAGPAGPAEDQYWFTLGTDGRVRRLSPWEAVAAATVGSEVVIKTEQLNRPGNTTARTGGPAPALDPVGLPAAAPAQAPRPGPQAGAGAPIPEQRGAGMSLPAHILPTSLGMHSQHDTEVTIDDVLDELERLTKESFTAHEKSIVIAERARAVRGQLEELAAELAVHHNVIGRLTSAAMARLAESMDLLAAKADEMRVQSLNAAEESEAAHIAMADEHRPVQQATADANLIVPSARIHNEG